MDSGGGNEGDGSVGQEWTKAAATRAMAAVIVAVELSGVASAPAMAHAMPLSLPGTLTSQRRCQLGGDLTHARLATRPLM